MKTNFKGFNKSYKGVLDKINDIIDKDMYGIGHSLSDAPYFGVVGESLENEKAIYKELEVKFKDLKDYLESITID